MARLEGLPGWAWDVLAARWEERYAVLQRFAAREGHARVPYSHLEDGVGLGAWVVAQRYQHRKKLLKVARVERLEATPGWVWDTHEAACQSQA